MNKKLKQQALLKHRIILQAAMCVEDILMETEKNGGRPWIAVVAEHMEALVKGREKEKYKRYKPVKPIVYASDCKPCQDCGEPWCSRHRKHYADCPCVGPDSE